MNNKGKDPKWVKAGKKAWATRRKNAAKTLSRIESQCVPQIGDLSSRKGKKVEPQIGDKSKVARLDKWVGELKGSWGARKGKNTIPIKTAGPVEKDPKWVAAGKKAWVTRHRRAGAKKAARTRRRNADRASMGLPPLRMGLPPLHSSKDPKWVAAGKKAWKTRRRNATKSGKCICPRGIPPK